MSDDSAGKPPVAGVLPSFQSMTIVEIAEGVAGPLCGMYMADLGARVIKIEPPEGDRAREWGPPMVGDTAAIFCHLNRGKQSVRIDLCAEAGRAALDSILAGADAVVFHADPDIRCEMALDWADMLARHPRLVVVDINDLGETGPFSQEPSSELVLQAMSGFTRYMGASGGDPCRVGYEIGWVGAGIHAHQAMLAGLLHVRASGEGQIIRVSMLKALMSMKTILLAAQVEPDKWLGFHLNGPRWLPDTGWKTSDGQVTFDFRHGERDAWVQFVQSIGLGHLADDPAYKDWRSTIYIGDRKHAEGKVYHPWFASVTSDEASARINGLGDISMKFNDYSEVLANEQVRLLEPVVEVPGAQPGESQQMNRALKFATALESPLRPAPRLGEHNAAVLGSVDGADGGASARGGQS